MMEGKKGSDREGKEMLFFYNFARMGREEGRRGEKIDLFTSFPAKGRRRRKGGSTGH